MIMNGYLGDPDATAESVTEDGFVSAGDIAVMDEERFLYIVDRKKDMIISGGLNVYGREVEQAIVEHPAVKAVAVIGAPSERWGEEVTAMIVVTDGREPPTPGELDSHCRASLAGYKVPRAYSFIDALPVSAAGKVLKRELRDQLAGAALVRPPERR